MRIDWNDLFEHAERARNNAYAPYSKFRVGVAVLATDGSLHIGCNVENASFPLGLCAERDALARMVVEGKRPRAVAVVGSSKRPTPPCGACRQVLYDLCPPKLEVRARGPSGKEARFTVGGLLPHAFKSSDL